MVSVLSFAQTNEERKKNADKNFENEDYIAATADYLHLLSLDPMSHELNFKYGACLLSNSNQKGKAIRYLSYAIQDENGDPRSHYFRGKALHLNFEFEAAKQNYKNYKSRNGGKVDKRYNVDREIEMCENGKRLLSTFTDIIVAEKREIDQAKFFRIYSDSKTIGGEILVHEDFQSKLDKKMGHVPIVHFPPNAKAIYYSSYGNDASTGLDIFIRRRLPNGGWGDPQILPGAVNTNADENFPYMHPSGNFLYFSSTGHNSMGGYDIFMSRFDPNINSFKRPENVDFAISSPDDDLFYVVDSLFQNAYFASSRQSADGNLHVYKVKVARVPIQEIIVMGNFLSEINPDNKTMYVELASHSNGESVGKIVTNDAGKYSFVFPQGGKYDYLIEVDGSDTQYKFTVELPFLTEFRPLKQKIIHTNENGEEIVKIVNLFDEDVEGAEALIAQIIRKKSELDINIDKYDIEAIEAGNREKEILAGAGFDNLSLTEVKDQLVEIQKTNEDNKAVSERIESNLNSEIVAKTERVKALDDLENELLAKANETNDPIAKHKLLNEAQKKALEKKALIDSIEALADLSEEAIAKIGLPENQVSDLSEVVQTFKAAVESGDDANALSIIDQNKEIISSAKSGSPFGVVNDYVDETKKIRAEIKKLKEREKDYASENERIKRDINALESKLSSAKRKEAEKLQSEIDDKKEELSMVEEEESRTKNRIKNLNRELTGYEDKIAGLQNAIATETVTNVDSETVKGAVKDVEEIASKESDFNYEKAIADVESSNPELFGLASADPIKDIKTNQSEKQAVINADESLTELEKTNQLKDNNEEAIATSRTQLDEIDAKLNQNPNDEELQAQKSSVENYITQLNDENKVLDDKAELLKSATSDVVVTKSDLIEEIDAGYQEEIAQIEAQDDISDKEKLDQIKEKQTTFLNRVEEELDRVKKDLKDDPSNSESQAKQDFLEELLAETQQDIDATESKIASATIDIVSVETVEANDVKPGLTQKMDKIESDESLTAAEKQEKLKEQEEVLIASIDKEQAKIEKKLKKNPEDSELLARKQGLDQLKEVTEASIDERNQTLAALGNDVEPTTNIAKEDIVASIDPEYAEKKKEFEKDAKKSRKGVVTLLDLETEMYERLKERKEELTEEVASSPDDEVKKDELAAVEELLQTQESTIGGLQDQLVVQMTEEERKDLIGEVDQNYSSEINSASAKDEIVDREVELQMAITEKLNEIQENQKRSFSVSAGLLERQYKKLLKESQDRESEARSAEPVAETPDKEEFIESLRDEASSALTDELTTATELNEQENALAQYEEKIESEIKDVESEMESNRDEELEEKLDWLKEELVAVQTKRRRVKIQIGELETNVASTGSDLESDSALKTLKKEQEDLEDKLLSDNVSTKEKREIEKELEDNLLAQTKRENEIVSSSIESGKVETQELNNQLSDIDPASSAGQAAVKAKNSIEKEEEIITSIEDKAELAKTEEEKNFLLKQAESKREALNNDTKEVVEEIKLGDLEKEENVSLQTQEDLEKKKRSFTIRIGELTNEIIQKEKEIAEAKRKDQPELEQEKKSLEEKRELVKDRLARVDEQLSEFEDKEPVVNPLSMKEEISFNEERQVAGTEKYEEYEALASDALEVEEQISNLEEELKLEKKAVAQLIADEKGNENQEEIQIRIDKIKAIESDIDRLNVDLIQKKWVADQALPDNEEEAMKMQNLVARGIKPIKTTVVAAAILQMPSTGFTLSKDAPSVYTAENPIPVGVESPTGLVYRVQIGAFAKPIPQDLFREFNPVSGEKINGTNITRYMAGFFNSSDDVVGARTQIRELGYSDAFVVAYCDGKRISFGEARRKEAEGTCVPRGTNELMVEVAEKTAEKLGLPLTREVQEVPELTYNEAPGAAEADPIEQMMGLFFTVQIGVYNRPVGKKNLYDMDEIITLRLPNGQIRYSSGRFDSVEEALPRRDLALRSGVRGAFVTAYYKGERIPLSKAKGLLAEKGEFILQSEIEREPIIETDDPDVPDVVRTDTVTNTNIVPVDGEGVNQLRVQVVTKQTFAEYPRDVLNRYNSEGSFYYDEEDGYVKSVIYKNEDYLPRLYNFRDDIDTVYIPMGMMDDERAKIVEVVFTDSIIPGDFMDMLLRFNYRKEMRSTENGVEVRMFGVQEDKLETILNGIREFGVEPSIREESELELELEENE